MSCLQARAALKKARAAGVTSLGEPDSLDDEVADTVPQVTLLPQGMPCYSMIVVYSFDKGLTAGQLRRTFVRVDKCVLEQWRLGKPLTCVGAPDSHATWNLTLMMLNSLPSVSSGRPTMVTSQVVEAR